jgi:hypothetical protein
MVEILTLWSPYKLLKNLGALSEYAEGSQSSTKIKKIKSLRSILDMMEWSKKPSHSTVPLKTKFARNGSKCSMVQDGREMVQNTFFLQILL